MSATWTAKPLKHACGMNRETLGEETRSEWEMQYLDIGAVDSAGNVATLETFTFANAPSRARRRVRNGDTVISTVRTYLKAIAHFEQPPENLIASTGFAVLSPTDKLDSRFLWRAVQDHGFVSQVVANSEGVGYPAIAPTRLAGLPISFPSFAEQRRIAGHLDEATGKIDRLMALRRRQMELLREQRAALIQQAVTGHLDCGGTPPLSSDATCRAGKSADMSAHSKFKDSGLPWLGQIPRHWEVKRLKFLARFKSGEGITSDGIADAGKYPVFGGNGVRGYANFFTHEGHFVLIGRQGALCGNINYAKDRFWASEHAVVATLAPGNEVYWFGEILRVMNLNQYSQSAAQPGLV